MLARRWAAVFIVAITAHTGWAQDPPAASGRHENKISAEARAAMEQFKSLVYRPGEHGLTSMTGEIVAVGFPSRPRSTFEFVSPARMKTTVLPGFDEEKRRLKLTGNLIQYPMSIAVDASDVFADYECDADVAEVNGAQVLRLAAFSDGKPSSSSEFEFDAAGRVVRHRWRTQTDDPRGDYVERYTWSKFGDLHCVAAIEVTFEGADAAHYACVFHSTDVGGVRVVASYDMTYFVKGAAPRTFAFHVDRLVVNGQSVELPTPWKHVNQVSPEAKTAMDGYAKLVYRPAEHGLATVSGELCAADGTPPLFQFRFLPPARVALAPAKGAQPTAAQRRMSVLQSLLPLRCAMEGMPLLDADEYDAELVERDGAKVLVITVYRDGTKHRTDEFTFDADGLLASASPGIEDAMRMTVTLEWEKTGGLSRVAAVDATVGGGATSLRAKTELAYSDVSGVQLLTSFRGTMSVVEGGRSMEGTASIRLDSLVVNGEVVRSPSASGEPK